MSFLSMMEERLPPGFRFHPRDEELVSDYLALKARGGGGGAGSFPTLVDVDLNKCEPWDLPGAACVGGKEWYFYSLRDRKYATGQRTNRATATGYWKATGKDRRVVEPRRGRLVGMRKTLVFYQGRAPRGKKTDWVMHEFRLEEAPPPPPAAAAAAAVDAAASKFSSNCKEDWVLCRVFYKSRGLLPAKTSSSNMENCYDDTGCSSQLPPLMDTFMVNFNDQVVDDPLELADDTYEQVPCFSTLLYPLGGHIPPPQYDHYCPEYSSAAAALSPGAGGDPAPPPRSSTHPGDAPAGGLFGSSYLNNTAFPCENKKAIRAVLEHFTKADGGLKMEVPQCQLAEGSSESYLTDHSSMWNTF